MEDQFLLFALECLLLDQNQQGPILVQCVMVEVNRGVSVCVLIMVIKFYFNHHVGGPLTVTDANLCLGRLLPEYVHNCSSCIHFTCIYIYIYIRT